MTDPTFLAPISEEIWKRKYRFSNATAHDETLGDTFRRVAAAAASVEKGGKRRDGLDGSNYSQPLTCVTFLNHSGR